MTSVTGANAGPKGSSREKLVNFSQFIDSGLSTTYSSEERMIHSQAPGCVLFNSRQASAHMRALCCFRLQRESAGYRFLMPPAAPDGMQTQRPNRLEV